MGRKSNAYLRRDRIMTQLSQYYKIKVDEPEKCKPAQFVYKDNDSDMVCGFVSNIDGEYAIFAFFEPVEIPEKAINIKSTITDEEVTILLKNALEQNPDIYSVWQEAVDNS